MDPTLPMEMMAARVPSRRDARDALPGGIDPRRPLTAVSGSVRYNVLRLAEREIVVENAGRAPMRGTVDLYAGGERVARLLVQLAWLTPERAGYELKRASLAPPNAPVPHGMRATPTPPVEAF